MTEHTERMRSLDTAFLHMDQDEVAELATLHGVTPS